MELVRSEVVGEPGFFRVENRWYRDQHGAEHLRQVVLHLGAVGVVPFDGHRVWLIRQMRVAVGRPMLEIPAGKLDVPDEDPVEAATRECVEEIGKRPGRLRPVASFYNSPGFTDEFTHIFIAEQLVDVVRDPKGAEEETAEIVALSLDAVKQMMAERRFDDAKTIVGLQALLAETRWGGEAADG
jgi:ADP-ribose pyrophosphatase